MPSQAVGSYVGLVKVTCSVLSGDMAREREVSEACDLTVYSVKLCLNISVKAIALNCEVHSTGLVTSIGTLAEDDGNGSGLVASLVVVAAVGGFLLLYHRVSNFPQHGKIVHLSGWQLSDLASGFISIIFTGAIIVVDIELEVKEGWTNLGVDKLHLVTLEILDEVWH